MPIDRKAYKGAKKKYKSAVKENKQRQKDNKSSVKSQTKIANKANKAEEKKQRKNPGSPKTFHAFHVVKPKAKQTGEKPKRSDYKQSKFEKQYKKGEKKGTNVYMGRGLGMTTKQEAKKFRKDIEKAEKRRQKSAPQKATGSSSSNARMHNMVNTLNKFKTI